MQFTIVHPVKKYNGAIDGLQFTNSQAVIDSENTSHITGGGSIEEILKRFEEKGFTVKGDRDALNVHEPEGEGSDDEDGAG